MARRFLAAAAAFTTCALASASALAAPCAGFVDVDDTSPFCISVQWIKNRAITTGCLVPNSYCPNDAVSRLAMAAFLARLGKAIEPSFVLAVDAAIAAAVNANAVVCQTPSRDFADYPRVVTVQGMLFHGGTAASTVSARIVYSVNGGAQWSDMGAIYSVATNPANGFASQSPVARNTTFIPPASVIFGIRTGDAGVTPSVQVAGCEIRVRWESKTGTPPFAPPYDADASDGLVVTPGG